MTPLHLAATQGQTECVLTLLKLGANPDAEGKENWPPILWAAHKGNADVVEVLCTASGHTRRHMQQVQKISFPELFPPLCQDALLSALGDRHGGKQEFQMGKRRLTGLAHQPRHWVEIGAL